MASLDHFALDDTEHSNCKVMGIIATALVLSALDLVLAPCASKMVSDIVQATADYTQPHLTAKASMSLNSSPLLDASVATGYDGFVAAVRGVVDVPRMALSTWELKAAYLGPNFVVGGHATQNLEKITGTYWQLLDPKTSVAVEVQHQAKDNKIGLLMGYSHIDLEGMQRNSVQLLCPGCIPCLLLLN